MAMIYGRCCNSMRVLWNYFQTLSKSNTSRSNNGWSCFHLNSLYLLPPQVGTSYLACAELLANFGVVLVAHGDVVEGVVMLWDCPKTEPIPLASPLRVWVTIVGISSTSTLRTSSASGGHHRIGLCLGLCINSGLSLSGSSIHPQLCYPRCYMILWILFVTESMPSASME